MHFPKSHLNEMIQTICFGKHFYAPVILIVSSILFFLTFDTGVLASTEQCAALLNEYSRRNLEAEWKKAVDRHALFSDVLNDLLSEKNNLLNLSYLGVNISSIKILRIAQVAQALKTVGNFTESKIALLGKGGALIRIGRAYLELLLTKALNPHSIDEDIFVSISNAHITAALEASEQLSGSMVKILSISKAAYDDAQNVKKLAFLEKEQKSLISTINQQVDSLESRIEDIRQELYSAKERLAYFAKIHSLIKKYCSEDEDEAPTLNGEFYDYTADDNSPDASMEAEEIRQKCEAKIKGVEEKLVAKWNSLAGAAYQVRNYDQLLKFIYQDQVPLNVRTGYLHGMKMFKSSMIDDCIKEMSAKQENTQKGPLDKNLIKGDKGRAENAVEMPGRISPARESRQLFQELMGTKSNKKE